MKTRSLAILLLAAALTPVYAGQTKPKADPLVYVTENGKKYHQKNCRLKHGSKGIKLSDAKKKGYKPCEVCKPPK